MEIVTLKQSLVLNIQGRCNELEYLTAFKVTATFIVMTDGYADESITAAKLVTKENCLNYKVANNVKKAVIMEEALKRYLTMLAFAGLNSEEHKKLKSDLKHDWVRNNTNLLPKGYTRA